MEEGQLYNKTKTSWEGIRLSRSVRITEKMSIWCYYLPVSIFFFPKKNLKFESVQSNNISAWIF